MDHATRVSLALFSRLFDWRDAVVNVRPSIIVRWHRLGWRIFWRLKCRGGRPPIPPELRSLIRRMAFRGAPYEYGATRGRAYWADEKKGWGRAFSIWQLEDGVLVGEVEREITSRVKRRQEAFRRLLLEGGGRCVITGEDTAAALHATHLIDAADGGRYGIADGVLMRADLHLLFDAHAFGIDAVTGSIVINPRAELSRSYRQLLRARDCIPKSDLRRIKETLARRNKKPKCEFIKNAPVRAQDMNLEAPLDTVASAGD
jgi:hypothetical protein